MSTKSKLSKSSSRRLDTCNEDIVLVIEESIKCTPVDFGVARGSITVDQLKNMFRNKQTKVNPANFIEKELKTKTKYKKELYSKVKCLVDKKSDKSDSVALFCSKNNNDAYHMIIGNVLATANRLKASKKISSDIQFVGITHGMIEFEII